MKRDTLIAGLVTLALMALAAAVMVVGISLVPEPAGATRDRVCQGLDSGKVDVSGDHKKVTVTAPAGYLVSGTCVKAGSVQQGNGPEYVDVIPPASAVVISHSSGKDISHWSASYVKAPTDTTTTTVPETTTTTVPETTTTTVPETTTTVPETTTTTVPDTTTTTEAPPVSVCVGEGEAEVCTSSITLEVSAPEAEPVEADPSFTG